MRPVLQQLRRTSAQDHQTLLVTSMLMGHGDAAAGHGSGYAHTHAYGGAGAGGVRDRVQKSRAEVMGIRFYSTRDMALGQVPSPFSCTLQRVAWAPLLSFTRPCVSPQPTPILNPHLIHPLPFSFIPLLLCVCLQFLVENCFQLPQSAAAAGSGGGSGGAGGAGGAAATSQAPRENTMLDQTLSDAHRPGRIDITVHRIGDRCALS